MDHNYCGYRLCFWDTTFSCSKSCITYQWTYQGTSRVVRLGPAQMNLVTPHSSLMTSGESNVKPLPSHMTSRESNVKPLPSHMTPRESKVKPHPNHMTARGNTKPHRIQLTADLGNVTTTHMSLRVKCRLDHVTTRVTSVTIVSYLETIHMWSHLDTQWRPGQPSSSWSQKYCNVKKHCIMMLIFHC